MFKTRIKLTFSIFGDDFDPHLVDNIMKIENTSYYKKGEVIANRNNLVRKETNWQYSEGFVETLFLDELTDDFVDLFVKKVELQQFINQYNLETKLEVILEIVDDEKPSLSFNKKFLHFINRINAEIDIDMYLLNSNRL